MADGKNHAKGTKRGLKILVPLSFVGMWYEVSTVGLGLGAIVGHLLTPDIDHHKWTHEEWRIYKWNKLLGYLWWLYWLPYEKLTPHRGISHVKYVGTLTRFLYLLWYPLWLSVGANWQIWSFWMFLYLGWTLQDNVHLRMDYRKKRRRRKIR